MLWISVFVFLTIFLAISTTWDVKLLLPTQLVQLHESFYDSVIGSNADLAIDNSKKCIKPLRVYMYDLPRRFNLGMLESRSKLDSSQKTRRVPHWPSRSGLRKQHSVEYWMMLYLLDSSASHKAAIRVLDPNVADVFYVPFFSSLSFNIHGVNMLDPDTEKDRLLQVDLVNFLHNSSWWQRLGGQDHVIPMHHPNALRFVREELNSSIFVVSDFGRYTQRVARLRKDVVAPYVHVVDSYGKDDATNPFEERSTLLFFRGTVRRKDEGIIRTRLASLLQNHTNVLFEDSTVKNGGIKLASHGMRQSRFCLTPAGDTPSSCRLFDAIVSHCVPVIISDKLELPFEGDLDYEDFCLILSVEEAMVPGYILGVLENFPKKRWLWMWRNLKRMAKHFEYQRPALSNDATDMVWMQVQHKLPALRLARNRLKRLKIRDWWHW